MNYKQFLREAQFHGAKRLADSSERYFWIITLVSALSCSSYMLYEMVSRYMGSPTFLVQKESVETLIPFPSVIVCPEIYFPDYKIDAYLNEIKLPPGVDRRYVRTVFRQLAAFFSPDVHYSPQDLHLLQHVLEYNDVDVEQAGTKLTSSCEETILKCRWNGSIVDCSTLFRMELTKVGYCCVFNGRSLKRELTEYGVRHGNTLHDEWFTTSTSHERGLMLVLNQTQKIDDVSLTYKWLAVEASQSYVDVAINGSAMSPGTERWAGYVKQKFQITDDTKNLAEKLRRCRTSDEPLQLFPIYNKAYCLLECESSRTLRRCRCGMLTQPRPVSAKPCRAHSLACARHAAVSLDLGSHECRCPAACDEEYGTMVVQDFRLIPNSNPYDHFYKELDLGSVSVVRVYALTHHRKTNSQQPYFNAYDLFSQLGGIFSVFFGCSVLTLLELFHLASCHLRAWIYPDNGTRSTGFRKLYKNVQ